MFKSTGRKAFLSGIGLILMGVVQTVLWFLNPEGAHTFGGPTEAFQAIIEGGKMIFFGSGIIGLRAKLNTIEPRSEIRKPVLGEQK